MSLEVSKMVEEEQLELRSPTTRTIAMPGDTNPASDVFGGWVLSQMDTAADICAGYVTH